MDRELTKSIADKLHQARVKNQAVEQFGKTIEDFETKSAYDIQELGISYRVNAGEKKMGYKMGLTSEAKRKQMDLHSPLYGELTDQMQLSNGGEFSIEHQIHPKIEPEIAFLIKDDLEGTITREQVLASTEYICSALEILDSRYTQFKYFSLQEVISDNSSSSYFILGEKVTDFKNIDLKNLKMDMKVNGEVIHTGNSEAISGDPVESVVQLASLLAERGRKIEKGSIVLAGAATAAIPLESGMQIDLTVEKLPGTSIKIK